MHASTALERPERVAEFLDVIHGRRNGRAGEAWPRLYFAIFLKKILFS